MNGRITLLSERGSVSRSNVRISGVAVGITRVGLARLLRGADHVIIHSFIHLHDEV